MVKTVIDSNTKQLVLSVDASRVKTKIQKAFVLKLLSTGNVAEAIEYLKSFSGEKAYLSKRSLKSKGEDRLAEKSPNSVLHRMRAMFDAFTDHSPTSLYTDYLGIEIECVIPRDSVPYSNGEEEDIECDSCGGTGIIEWEDERETPMLDDNGEETGEFETTYEMQSEPCDECHGSGYVSNPNYSEGSGTEYHDSLAEMIRENKIKYCSVKEDGSLRCDPDYFPVEFTILTRLGDPSNLKKLCNLLSRLDAKVNRSCGLHVHLDARHLDEDYVDGTIRNNFDRALPVLLSMVPITRRENDYCRPVVAGVHSNQRYAAVNLSSYRKHKSIEIRLHSSTTDFDKIFNWSKLVHAIMCSNITRRCYDLNDLTDFISIPEELVEYASQRIALFSPEQDNTSESVRDTDSIAI